MRHQNPEMWTAPFKRASNHSTLTEAVFPVCVQTLPENGASRSHGVVLADLRPAGRIRPPPRFMRPGTLFVPSGSAGLSLNC